MLLHSQPAEGIVTRDHGKMFIDYTEILEKYRLMLLHNQWKYRKREIEVQEDVILLLLNP